MLVGEQISIGPAVFYLALKSPSHRSSGRSTTADGIALNLEVFALSKFNFNFYPAFS